MTTEFDIIRLEVGCSHCRHFTAVQEEIKAHTGHRGAGGIQGHSAGPIFPYHIVLKGDDTLYAQHAEGSELSHFRYGGVLQTFHEAYAKAEKQATNALHLEATQHMTTEEAAGWIRKTHHWSRVA